MKITPPNHFQCPNDLVDHWLPHLSGVELKCLLVIIRKTFGWHKVRDRISLSQMVKLTGSTKSNIKDATDKLHDMGIILKEVIGTSGNEETYYEINFMDSKNSYQSQNETPPGLETRPPPVSKQDPQKTSSKDTSTKEQQTTPLSVVVPLEKEKRAMLLPFDLLEKVVAELITYDIDRIKNAIESLRLAQSRGDVPNPSGFIVSAIRDGYKPSKTKQDIEEERESERSKKEKKMIGVKAVAARLEEIHKHEFTKEYSFSVTNNIALKVGNRVAILQFYEDNCLQILAEYIEKKGKI